ncbi:MAG: plasmid mobilization relaxosome protein MobC [Sphingobacteriales bacterium]|nr:plasmid mobilization relaxosome protein MobC [Sphingobacteriales bacterium]MBI3717589.1 plasmid mobilization relaxosome protein MobC [Sphingobacteriales bacterium]
MKKENRKRFVGIRFTTNEYEQIEKKWKASTCRKLSEYVRKIMFNRPIVATYRNKSLDDLMTELIQLKKELNGIGNNFNQSVKKLHTLQQIPEFRQWIELYKMQNDSLLQKVEEIKFVTGKIGEQWLQ